MDQNTEENPNSFDQTIGRFLTYRLSRVQARLNAQSARILQNAAGLSVIQWRIIKLVAGYDGATSTELTALASIDKGLFSRKLKLLVQDGIVRARTNDSDNRINHLYLTERGRKVYDRVLPVMSEHQERLSEGIGKANAELLLDLLTRLEDVIERTPEP